MAGEEEKTNALYIGDPEKEEEAGGVVFGRWNAFPQILTPDIAHIIANRVFVNDPTDARRYGTDLDVIGS